MSTATTVIRLGNGSNAMLSGRPWICVIDSWTCARWLPGLCNPHPDPEPDPELKLRSRLEVSAGYTRARFMLNLVCG